MKRCGLKTLHDEFLLTSITKEDDIMIMVVRKQGDLIDLRYKAKDKTGLISMCEIKHSLGFYYIMKDKGLSTYMTEKEFYNYLTWN